MLMLRGVVGVSSERMRCWGAFGRCDGMGWREGSEILVRRERDL